MNKNPEGRIGRNRIGGAMVGSQVLAVGVAICALALPSCINATAPPASSPVSAGCAQTLVNIQQCITNAALDSVEAKNEAPLSAVADVLRAGLTKDRGPSLYYRSYWLAYADYLGATLALGQKQSARVDALTAEADSLLEKLEVKDQETYALQDLNLLLRFAIAKPGDVPALTSRTVGLRGKLAGATSIRAKYALALADLYTPRQYGGGRLAEALLRDALTTPAEAFNPLKPTWGRDDSAALLIKILLQSGSKEEAAALYRTWQQRYPRSIALAQFAGLK